MIAFVKGSLVVKTPTHVIVDNGGIGYLINISINTYSAIADLNECLLHTYHHVREDANLLYGFYDVAEKDLFEHLISVNGIGPNTARTILSYADPNELKQAIVGEKVALIQKIKGIGVKTAQRMVLELKDKLAKEGVEQIVTHISRNNRKEEALLALVALGFAKPQMDKVLDNIIKTNDEGISVESLIKLALKSV